MKEVFAYVIGLGPAVMMPVIFTILGVAIGIKTSNALKSGLLVGVGFVGLGVVTALLTVDKNPADFGFALGRMMDILGLKLKAFDLGWPAAADVAYSTAVGAFIIPVCLGVNIAMFLCGATRTVNIDLWNYWHFAFLGAIVFFATGSLGWAFFAAVMLYIITLCMADFTAKGFQRYYKDMDGISIPQPFCQSFTPFAVAVNGIVERIPGVKNWNIDADGMKQKFGILGEPLFLGILFGVAIGFLSTQCFASIKAAFGATGWAAFAAGANYKAFAAAFMRDLPVVLKVGITMGAVMVLIPRITGLFIEGLKPIADKTREVLSRKFKNMNMNIGMSPALVIGHPATLIATILLIPFTILLAVVLPGNKFLPVASLAGVFYLFPCVLPVVNGNVFRTFLAGLAAMIVGLYFATDLAPVFADAIKACGKAQYQVPQGFESGAALDFASALWCWLGYHLTVSFKYAGAALLAVFTAAMAVINFIRIKKESNSK